MGADHTNAIVFYDANDGHYKTHVEQKRGGPRNHTESERRVEREVQVSN
jgi:hypothetical protein